MGDGLLFVAAMLVGFDASVPESQDTPDEQGQAPVSMISLLTPAGTPIGDFRQLSSKT